MVQGRKHRRQQQAALKVAPAKQNHLPWVAEGLGPNLGRGIHSAVESRRRVAAPKNNTHGGSGSGTFHVEHYRVKQRPGLGHRHISDHQAAQSPRFHYPSQAPTSPASPANPLQDAPHLSKRDHIKEQPRSFCRNGARLRHTGPRPPEPLQNLPRQTARRCVPRGTWPDREDPPRAFSETTHHNADFD